jgi:hypothetical protein
MQESFLGDVMALLVAYIFEIDDHVAGGHTSPLLSSGASTLLRLLVSFGNPLSVTA